MAEGLSRRTLMITAGFTLLTSVGLTDALADNLAHALYGTYYMQCPKCGNVDMVEKGTAQHVCQNRECQAQMFARGRVMLVRRSHHENVVDLSGVDALRSYTCKTCKVDCQGVCG
jgi:uncharacterized C2H2 Zn-finger protein